VIQDVGVLKWNLDSGQVTKLEIAGLDGLGELAFDSKTNTLYGIDELEGNLLRIDIERNESEILGTIDVECHGLAFDPERDILYSNNENLLELNPKNGKATIIGSIGVEGIRGLAFDSDTKTLYGADIVTNQLIHIDTQSGKGTEIGSFIWKYNQNQPLKLGTWGLTVNSNQNKLYGSTTAPLIQIDPQTAHMENFDNKITGGEESQLYQNYVRRMQTILEKRDLTYLYTCVLEDRAQKMRYVLESPQDSPYDIGFVGYEDPDTPEEGIRDSWLKGSVFLSEIIYWEEWGYLKSAYSPIYNQDKIVGLAGADVNISIINKKTNIALIKVLIIGLGSLIIGILVSFYITRKLTEPISQLKDGALLVAAGKYGQQIEIKAPSELETLANSFNKMSKSLKDTITQLTRSNEELEKRRRTQELMRFISRKIDDATFADSALLVHDYFFIEDYSFNASGWFMKDDKFVLWLADSPENALDSIKLKNDIYEIMKRAYISSDGVWDRMKEKLDNLFVDVLYCVCFFDPEHGILKSYVRRDVNMILSDNSGEIQIINLKQTDSIYLQSNHMIMLSSLDLAKIANMVNLPKSISDSEFEADILLQNIKRILSSFHIDDRKDNGIVALMVKK
jgi:HAMP domain-containing protein